MRTTTIVIALALLVCAAVVGSHGVDVTRAKHHRGVIDVDTRRTGSNSEYSMTSHLNNQPEYCGEHTYATVIHVMKSNSTSCKPKPDCVPQLHSEAHVVLHKYCTTDCPYFRMLYPDRKVPRQTCTQSGDPMCAVYPIFTCLASWEPTPVKTRWVHQ